MTTEPIAPNAPISRATRLKNDFALERADIDELAEGLDESTRWSWLWAFLFGAIYYARWGFWGRAIIVFALNIVIIGFIISPFLVYPAWRSRAKEKARKVLLVDRIRRSR